MSDYVRKYRRLTAAQWDWIRAKHRAGWDLAYIMADVGYEQSIVRDVIEGRKPRPEPHVEHDDKHCYLPTRTEILRECIKFREAHLRLKRAELQTNHNPIGGIREVSTRGNRRLSTVGVDA